MPSKPTARPVMVPGWHAKALPWRSEASWHRLRAQHIGGTEQPALWGHSPYQTALAVYHTKKGTIEDSFEENERMTIGKFVEPAIAQAALHLHNKEGQPWGKSYLVHPEVRGMGVSLDWIVKEGDGFVPLEIKNVAGMEWASKWALGDGAFEPPLHIDLQVQHQIAVTGAAFAYIAVLVGGSKIELVKRPRVPEVQNVVTQKVREFWDNFDQNIEPEIDVQKDYEILQRARMNVNGQERDMRGDEEVESLVSMYARGKQMEKDGELLVTEAKTRLLLIANEYETLMTNVGKVTAKIAPAKESRVVEYRPQPERRDLRVYPAKKKETAE